MDISHIEKLKQLNWRLYVYHRLLMMLPKINVIPSKPKGLCQILPLLGIPQRANRLHVEYPELDTAYGDMRNGAHPPINGYWFEGDGVASRIHLLRLAIKEAENQIKYIEELSNESHFLVQDIDITSARRDSPKHLDICIKITIIAEGKMNCTETQLLETIREKLGPRIIIKKAII